MPIDVKTKDEEMMLWKEFMELWRDHPMWVIDNLEKFQEFKVSWNNYGRFKVQCKGCLTYNPKDAIVCMKCGESLKHERILTMGVGKPPKMAKKQSKTD